MNNMNLLRADEDRMGWEEDIRQPAGYPNGRIFKIWPKFIAEAHESYLWVILTIWFSNHFWCKVKWWRDKYAGFPWHFYRKTDLGIPHAKCHFCTHALHSYQSTYLFNWAPLFILSFDSVIKSASLKIYSIIGGVISPAYEPSYATVSWSVG